MSKQEIFGDLKIQRKGKDHMQKPNRLKKGDKIAILAPSAGLVPLYPHIYQKGISLLQKMGFETVEMSSCYMNSQDLYYNPKLRAKEIQEAFLNPEINGIITTIGGDESIRILPYLDVEQIRNHPKFIMEFSDATTFLSYFASLGMITFYGPSVMAGLAQAENLESRYVEHFNEILLESLDTYCYQPYQNYVEGYQDWNKEELAGFCLEEKKNEGFWFSNEGEVQGRIWGGCIEVLEFMKGTKFFPTIEFFKDKILIFETSEDKPTPVQVGYMLRNYGTQGILSQVKGILFGREKDYSQEEKMELRELVSRIVGYEFERSDMPIVMNVDFGHTDPKFILPLGSVFKIDGKRKTICLMENPFSK